MKVNWKSIFRNHLIDTKNDSSFTTIFDINKYNSLLKVTETNKKFGPDEYLQTWELQGDEKYNNIIVPKEDIIYTFPKCLIWITRVHGINNDSLEWKDCQLWKFIIILDGKLYDSGVISSLEKNHVVKCYNIPKYIEIGVNDNILKIKNNVIYWNTHEFDISLSNNFQSNKCNISNKFELLNLFKISQNIKNGFMQHFTWKYNNSLLDNIIHIFVIMIKENKYKSLLNLIEYKNNIPRVINIRKSEIEIPQIKNSKEWNIENIKIKHTHQDNSNWSWTFIQNPKSININKLFPPFEEPYNELFKEQSVDILPICTLFTLIIILTILLILFSIYPII